MANVLKGITIEIGGDTTKLTKALSDVQSKSNALSSELRDVNRLLKYDPSNVELLAQKQKILAEQITTTKSKLETLKEAQKQVNEQFARGEASEEQVRAIERAVADTEQKLKIYEKAAEQTADEVENLGNESDNAEEQIDNLGDEVEDSSNKFEKLKTVAKAAAAGLATAFAAVGAAAVATGKALVEMSISGAQYADTVLTESTVTGIATDKLQGYMYAAELVDVSTETLTKSMAKQIKSMNSAAQGSKNYTAAYKELGISVTDANGQLRDSEAVYWEIIDALGKVENETQRDALGMTLLGKSAQELNPLIEAGAERMKELGVQAEEAGYIMSGDALQAFGEFDDKIQYLKVGADAAKNALGTVLLPLLSELAGTGVDLLGEFSRGVQAANGDISKIGDVISEVLPKALSEVSNYIPKILGVVSSIVNSLIKAISDNSGKILDSVAKVAADIVKTITNSAPNLVKAATDAVVIISKAIIQNLPEILKSAIEIVNTLIKGISDALPKLVPTAAKAVLKVAETIVENAPQLLKSGLELIVSLTKGIIDSIPKIVSELPKIITAITNFFSESIDIIVESGIELFTALVEAMPTIINSIVSALPQIITAIVNFYSTNYPKMLSSAIDLFMALVKAIPTVVKSLAAALPQIWNTLKSFLSGLPSQAWSIISTGFSGMTEKVRTIGQNLIRGLGNGISDMVGWVMSKVKSFGSSILSSLKSFFGIHSPSTVMRDQVGKNLALGIVEGLMDNVHEVKKAAKVIYDTLVNTGHEDMIRRPVRANALKLIGDMSDAFEKNVDIPKKALTKTLNKAANEARKAAKGDYAGLGENIIAKISEGMEEQKDAVGHAGRKVLKEFRNQMLAEASTKEEKNLLKNFFNESIDVLEDSIDKEYTKVIEAASQKIKDFTAQIQAEYDAVKKLQADMERNLTESKLFTEEDGEVQLTNFKNQTDKIRKYSHDMQVYKDKISEELMAEIAQLSMEDAQKVLDKFKTMTDEELKAYDESYTQMVEEAKKASSRFYQEQLDEIDKEYREGIKEIFSEVKTEMLEAGQQAINGFVEGMNDKSGDAYAAAKKIAKETVNVMKEELDVHSPSKKFAEIGKFAMLGLAQGIKSNASDPIKAIENTAKSMLDETEMLGNVNLSRNIKSAYTIETSQDRLQSGLFQKLDSVIKAIERGQVMTIDGKTLVGSTIERVDRSLGNRANLYARGAL